MIKAGMVEGKQLLIYKNVEMLKLLPFDHKINEWSRQAAEFSFYNGVCLSFFKSGSVKCLTHPHFLEEKLSLYKQMITSSSRGYPRITLFSVRCSKMGPQYTCILAYTCILRVRSSNNGVENVNDFVK